MQSLFLINANIILLCSIVFERKKIICQTFISFFGILFLLRSKHLLVISKILY